jgi:hypothetical protein
MLEAFRDAQRLDELHARALKRRERVIHARRKLARWHPLTMAAE